MNQIVRKLIIETVSLYFVENSKKGDVGEN